jgi:hypothetical protein
MAILILLVILLTSHVLRKLLLARPANASRLTRPQSACKRPPAGEQSATGSQGRPLWTALDDHQLTRLLTDAAPRSTTE